MSEEKTRVGILFGGKSAEHEVSLRSAKNVIDAINRDKYEPILIGIDKSGKWLLNDQSDFLLNSDNPKLISLNQASDNVAIVPQSEGLISNLTQNESDRAVDVVFPILHGPFGEDGTVQGLLKLANLPFVGAGVLGSSVGMDKDVMKRLLRDAEIPIGDFMVVRSGEPVPDYAFVEKALGSPVFIKPANMGSSVGVSKVDSESTYNAAITEAFDFDLKIIIEACIQGREIECSILGNENPEASVPGEVIPHHDFYSYEAKYIDENGAGLIIPANLPEETVKKVQDMAVRTFKVLDCEGMARVDVFLTEKDEVVVNEINTLPGFTSISMYPKLWEASGISYADLIDRLIQLAIQRFNKEQKLKTTYL